MEQQLCVPLDLPDVRILKVSQTETSEWLIRVEITVKENPWYEAWCGFQVRLWDGERRRNAMTIAQVLILMCFGYGNSTSHDRLTGCYFSPVDSAG